MELMSQQIDKLAAALSKAQSELEAAPKDAKNPHFKSRYATLAACMSAALPVLTKNGLAVVQSPTTNLADGSVAVMTTIMHSSGQWFSAELSCKPKSLLPQDVGSAVTYLRRYCLSSVVGIISEEDDDGNQAQGLSRPLQPPMPPMVKSEPQKETSKPNHSLAKKVLLSFQDYGVGRDMLEKLINNKLELMTESQTQMLRDTASDLKIGKFSVEDVFGVARAVDDLNKSFA